MSKKSSSCKCFADIKVLSLFANIGVAEAFLSSLGIDVAVANELIERRADLYAKIYPETKMIAGDITQKSVFETIVEESRKKKVNLIMATPPCQGMSTAGQQQENDERNKLILPVLEIIKEISPKYVFLENVPMFLKTCIFVNGERILIPDLISKQLGQQYVINTYVIDTKNYSVPQTRERAIMLLSKKGENHTWLLPDPDCKVVTMHDSIGNLPPLDPFVKDISYKKMLELFPLYEKRAEVARSISPWHMPPEHIWRQVQSMRYTPTGQTAFNNTVFPPTKEDGTLVKGYKNTYKRQNWNTAAYTVTMDNRKISSQNNVHPGRPDGVDSEGRCIYSDARALTTYELMKIMSLPDDWPVPLDTPDAFLRRIIGEGIPPLFVKKVFENLLGGKKCLS